MLQPAASMQQAHLRGCSALPMHWLGLTGSTAVLTCFPLGSSCMHIRPRTTQPALQTGNQWAARQPSRALALGCSLTVCARSQSSQPCRLQLCPRWLQQHPRRCSTMAQLASRTAQPLQPSLRASLRTGAPKQSTTLAPQTWWVCPTLFCDMDLPVTVPRSFRGLPRLPGDPGAAI